MGNLWSLNPADWFADEEIPALPPPPEYMEDPDFRKTQDFLRDLGINILDGDIPDYYRGIGETGGAEFENYLNLLEGDIQKNALETSAAMGRGGGRALEVASRDVGRLSTEARYNDFMRALEGKKWLFGEGRGITEGVRAAGQQEGVNRNAFNLKSYDITRDNMLWGINRKDENDAMQGEVIADIFNRGVGAFVGGATGGPTGAIAGAMGGADWMSIFDQAVKPKTTSQDPNKKIGFGSISGKSEIQKLLNMLNKKPVPFA